MKIYRPVLSNWLNQGFGENFPCARRRENGTLEVISGHKVCPAGYEKFYPMIGLKGHNGLDNMAWSGEPLYFPVECEEAGGWRSVNASDLDGGLGVDVISKSKVLFNGRKTYIKFRFWHLKEGYALDDVQLGQLIGLCDNTGASSGSHLHWSAKPCDKDGNSTEKNNGYYGAEDFWPYYENVFVLNVLKVKGKALSVIDMAQKLILQVKLFLSTRQK